METLAVRALSFAYPGRGEKALDGVDLSVEDGDFFVLCGPSGSGKSTLLRQMKPAIASRGTRTGEILFRGALLEELDGRTQSRRIGFVGQSPEDQLVTDKVWHELAFGLESLGLSSSVIRRRVSEMASFFGIQTWFDRDVAELSGGQKQLLNLAAVMATQPDLLILDEPTSRLDPIAAAEFLSMLGRLNRELGTTVLLAEHRLEDAFPLANAAAVLDGGRVVCQGTPRFVCAAMGRWGHSMFLGMPAAARVWAAVDGGGEPPVTVREGRAWLERFAGEHTLCPLPEEPAYARGEVSVRAKELWFRYEKHGADVLKGLSLTAHGGELLALLGGNGTGKTTAVRAIAGYLKPYRGAVSVKGRAAVLPQDPRALFVKQTVAEDLADVTGNEAALGEMLSLCRLEGLTDRHPYDLSGGEQQRAALAKVLLAGPDILLLDEPTKGIDPEFKAALGEILQALCRQGKTVIMVSHDVDFCARFAHRCALFFDGGIVAEDTPRALFPGNGFYTTSVNRMARTVEPQAVTAEDLAAVCGGTLPEPRVPPPAPRSAAKVPDVPAPVKRPRPARSSILAAVLILLCIPLTVYGGMRFLENRRYTLISLLVLLEAMLPFFLVFEGRRPPARQLAVIAALCAVAVAGRAALFMLPQCKPVIAVAVIAGAGLGCETGFLVGAVSMLVSNMLFGQGPWTPWQMFAVGIIGFAAGLVFSGHPARRRRWALCVFGGAASVVLFGGLMNLSSALLWADPPTWPVLLSYYAAGFPMDCVQAAATMVFLWFAAGPVLDQLDRVKRKYGLTD